MKRFLKLLLLISILPIAYFWTEGATQREEKSQSDMYTQLPELPDGCQIFPGAQLLIVYPGGYIGCYRHNRFTGWGIDKDIGLDWVRNIDYIVERQKDFNEREESPWD